MIKEILPLLILIPALFFPLSVHSKETSLHFIHFNDLYQLHTGPRSNGLPGIKQAIDIIKKEKNNAIASFGGDLFPSYVDLLTLSCPKTIEFFNQLSLDFAVFGNHEFDEGTSPLVECLKKSKHTWLAGNIKDSKNRDLFKKKYVIKEISGIKVGFFSVLTKDTKDLSNSEDLSFEDETSFAERTVKALKNKGAQFIVAYTHQEVREDVLLARSVPDINLILGGHDHTAVIKEIGSTLVVKAGVDGEYIGLVTANLKKKEKKVSFSHWESSLVSTKKFSPDKDLHEKMNQYLVNNKGKLYDTILTIMDSFDTLSSLVRFKESRFASFIADTFRDYYQADIAMINGGAIRGNKKYSSPVSISKAMISQELPFVNRVILTKIKGKNLKSLFKSIFNEYIHKENPMFPHLSGLTLEYKKNKELIEIQSIKMMNGEKIQPEKDYTFALTDYLFNGGDNFPAQYLSAASSKKEPLIISEVVLHYIKKQSQDKISLPPLGRHKH